MGFSPSQPTTDSWVLPGERKRIPYENPQGRRVNAVAILLPFEATPELRWDRVARTITATDIVDILEVIPRFDRELVVVLDNASIHTAKVVKQARERLAEAGIRLYYLPPYSPELNRIEPYFGVLKRYELPERTYPTIDALKAAIDEGFTRCEHRLVLRSQLQPRPAA